MNEADPFGSRCITALDRHPGAAANRLDTPLLVDVATAEMAGQGNAVAFDLLNGGFVVDSQMFAFRSDQLAAVGATQPVFPYLVTGLDALTNEAASGSGAEKHLGAAAKGTCAFADKGDRIRLFPSLILIFVDLIAKTALGRPGGHGLGTSRPTRPNDLAVSQSYAGDGGIVLSWAEKGAQVLRLLEHGPQFLVENILGRLFGWHEVEDVAGQLLD